MPYIITTTTLHPERPFGLPAAVGGIVTRRAVATLDEYQDAALKLPESGGTIKLPDGTVIEVKPVHDGVFGLREFARPVLGAIVDELGIGELIDAYNAAQA